MGAFLPKIKNPIKLIERNIKRLLKKIEKRPKK